MLVCLQAFSKALRLAQSEVDKLKSDIGEGKLIAQFGSKADTICNKVHRIMDLILNLFSWGMSL
jgi:hypothetical protein